jgi:hypothetical protein
LRSVKAKSYQDSILINELGVVPYTNNPSYEGGIGGGLRAEASPGERARSYEKSN